MLTMWTDMDNYITWFSVFQFCMGSWLLVYSIMDMSGPASGG